MKKLNITKEAFSKSKYFTKKYGTLKYVSESGRLFKTSKGNVLKFTESSEVQCDGCGEMVHDDTVEIVGDQVLCDKCRSGVKKESNDDKEYMVTDIKWELDRPTGGLPEKTKVTIPRDVYKQGGAAVDEYICNYLCDTYGVSISGFEMQDMDDMMQESHNDLDNDPAYECPYCGGHNCEFNDAEDYPEEGYFDGSTLKTCFHCLDCEEYYQVEFSLNVKDVKSMKVQNRKGGRFR